MAMSPLIMTPESTEDNCKDTAMVASNNMLPSQLADILYDYHTEQINYKADHPFTDGHVVYPWMKERLRLFELSLVVVQEPMFCQALRNPGEPRPVKQFNEDGEEKPRGAAQWSIEPVPTVRLTDRGSGKLDNFFGAHPNLFVMVQISLPDSNVGNITQDELVGEKMVPIIKLIQEKKRNSETHFAHFAWLKVDFPGEYHLDFALIEKVFDPVEFAEHLVVRDVIRSQSFKVYPKEAKLPAAQPYTQVEMLLQANGCRLKRRVPISPRKSKQLEMDDNVYAAACGQHVQKRSKKKANKKASRKAMEETNIIGRIDHATYSFDKEAFQEQQPQQLQPQYAENYACPCNLNPDSLMPGFAAPNSGSYGLDHMSGFTFGGSSNAFPNSHTEGLVNTDLTLLNAANNPPADNNISGFINYGMESQNMPTFSNDNESNNIMFGLQDILPKNCTHGVPDPPSEYPDLGGFSGMGQDHQNTDNVPEANLYNLFHLHSFGELPNDENADRTNTNDKNSNIDPNLRRRE